jgi:hypothetical protein
MEAEVIKQEQTSGPTFPKHVPFPYMEGVVVGILAGAIGGIMMAATAFDMEAEAIGAVLLGPFFAIVGACCGFISKRFGWAKVRPLAWAMLGGLFYFDTPIGWIIGGMVGGLINAVVYRSSRKPIKRVLAGASVGLLGWGTVVAYLLFTGFILRYFLD